MHTSERVAPNAPNGLRHDATWKSVFQTGAERKRIGGEEETNVGIGIHLPLHGGEKSRIGAFGYGSHAVGTANVNAHDSILERAAEVVDALLQSGDGVQKLREMGGIWLENIARGHIYIIVGVDESR